MLDLVYAIAISFVAGYFTNEFVKAYLRAKDEKSKKIQFKRGIK